MKRILFDVNVVLDILLDRKPHAQASGLAWAAVEEGKVEGCLAAHGLTTIHYLVCRERGPAFARRTLSRILRVFRVAAVDAQVIDRALRLPWPDFEDAVSAAAGEFAQCDAIITRDPKGFPNCPIRILTPEAGAALLHLHGANSGSTEGRPD